MSNKPSTPKDALINELDSLRFMLNNEGAEHQQDIPLLDDVESEIEDLLDTESLTTFLF